MCQKIFYPRTSKFCCPMNCTLYSLQSLECPLCSCTASLATPSRCELMCRTGCWVCALRVIHTAKIQFGLCRVSSAHAGKAQLPPLSLGQARLRGEQLGARGWWRRNTGWQLEMTKTVTSWWPLVNWEQLKGKRSKATDYQWPQELR